MFTKKSLVLIIATLFLIVGCSDQDNPTTPDRTSRSLSAIIRGDFPEPGLDFEFAAKVGEGIEDQGELMVRGRNMGYDESMGALAIDLSVYNGSDTSYPLPVGLTFLQFIPEGVTLVESDNDQNGVGAMIMFEFENEDLSWTPGEESIPRTVHFVIESGTSLGFVARVDAGLAPMGGTIGGMVWHDMNEDGVMDPDEPGVGDIPMALYPNEDMTMGPLISVKTDEDGTYRFPGQSAGFYTVQRMPVEGVVGTTPSEMAVILVDMDGTVTDFMAADFGVTLGDDPGDDFVRVGDYVEARGDYMEEPDRLVSDRYKVKRCDGSKDHGGDDDEDCDDDGDCDDDDDCDDDCDDDDDCDWDDDDCDGHDDGCRQNECWGRFSGPLTGWSLEERFIEIMGTKVYAHDKKDWDCDDWFNGFRIRLDVTMGHDGMVRACKHPKKAKKYDEIRGYVQDVVRGDDDAITGVIVLNTLIEFEDKGKPRD